MSEISDSTPKNCHCCEITTYNFISGLNVFPFNPLNARVFCSLHANCCEIKEIIDAVSVGHEMRHNFIMHYFVVNFKKEIDTFV